jgi:hypothetical protein
MYSNCVETIAINNILRLHHITSHARGVGGGGGTYSWPLGLKEAGERIFKFGSGEKSRLSCEITVRRDLTVGETDRHGFFPPPPHKHAIFSQ